MLKQLVMREVVTLLLYRLCPVRKIAEKAVCRSVFLTTNKNALLQIVLCFMFYSNVINFLRLKERVSLSFKKNLKPHVMTDFIICLSLVVLFIFFCLIS